MNEKAYLDFYEKHQIIPVRQDKSDMVKHFNRRGNLYKQIGIPPALLKDKSVIEFGPGSGDNAIFTASLKPGRYVLVDGNSTSIRELHKKLNEGAFGEVTPEICNSNILGYQDDRQFEIVLCEGVVPNQENSSAFLKEITTFAAPGGIVCITTMSPFSCLAEVCRRVMRPFFSQEIDCAVEEGVKFFREDLLSLTGMSRLHDDWVLDNILHPWGKNLFFSIPAAIEAISDDFDFYGSSPTFLTDWRWYKSVNGLEFGTNDMAKKAYACSSLFLIDYRIDPAEMTLPVHSNWSSLEKDCNEAYEIHMGIWLNGDIDAIYTQFLPLMAVISKKLGDLLPITARSLQDFISGMHEMKIKGLQADFKSFRTWFGRGQQYVSFIRRAN
ncbi:MAG: class I SAM-dependent methyltransferase [Betaproteobacteria bacterium]|nr:class I SAM-dependent methyltransferase [Betaproteobacteria bacterium]